MDSRETEDAWSVDLPSCRPQDLYPASGPAPTPAVSPAAALPAPITRCALEEACRTQATFVQRATAAGTLKVTGARTPVRQHIQLGLAIAQTVLGQSNTVQRTQSHSHGYSQGQARPDTAGGQVRGQVRVLAHRCT